jgi:transcriptional regulator with XRE-family HTH domain
MPFASPQLRTRRVASGTKSGVLAQKVGVTQSHLINVERGRQPGSPELFARIATALGIDVDQLIAAADDDSGPGAP